MKVRVEPEITKYYCDDYERGYINTLNVQVYAVDDIGDETCMGSYTIDDLGISFSVDIDDVIYAHYNNLLPMVKKALLEAGLSSIFPGRKFEDIEKTINIQRENWDNAIKFFKENKIRVPVSEISESIVTKKR